MNLWEIASRRVLKAHLGSSSGAKYHPRGHPWLLKWIQKWPLGPQGCPRVVMGVTRSNLSAKRGVMNRHFEHLDAPLRRSRPMFHDVFWWSRKNAKNDKFILFLKNVQNIGKRRARAPEEKTTWPPPCALDYVFQCFLMIFKMRQKSNKTFGKKCSQSESWKSSKSFVN